MNGLYYGYGGTVDMFLLLIGFLITLIAQIKVKSAYSKYSKEDTRGDLSGCEVARKILDSADLKDIHVVEVPGELTDHYDPRNKVVRLSTKVFHDSSVASVAVAAHECGHAIQDKENYTFMRIRASLVPMVNFVNKFGYIATIIGLIAGIFDILVCGIVMILATLLFQLVTLPVEFDASKRAKKKIDELKLASKSEQDGVKSMLSAAAFTYVASVLESLFQLLRLVLRFRDREDR